MASRPMFYLIDGHALAYRQYFGNFKRAPRTSYGEPTGASGGFSQTILNILDKDQPEYLAVTFDLGLSGRDTLYDEYKGTREKMEDELAIQIPRIQEIVSAFNIPILEVEGYEADDIIGTIVPQVVALGADVRIVTGDKDILQLLTEHITVQLPPRGSGDDVVYTLELFREEYGLEPPLLVDLKALMGDSSDNIPGVKGIGEKGGIALLKAYGNLDGIYENLDQIKGSVHDKLVAGRDMAYLSLNLARIRRDVPIAFDLEKCRAHDFDPSEVDDIFALLEFRRLRDQLAPRLENLQEQKLRHAHEVIETVIVRDAKTLQALVETLINARAIVWDVETTGTDQMADDLVGISLAVDGKTGYYIPVGHVAKTQMALPLEIEGETEDSSETPTQLPLATVLDALRPAMTASHIPKYAHNASFDFVVLNRYGLAVQPITFDTMVAEWVLDPNSKFLGLKDFARQRLGMIMTEIKELIGTGKKQITMAQVAVATAAPYAAADAAVTFRAVTHLQNEFAKDKPNPGERSLFEIFETLEMPFVPVVAALEQAGVVLDTAHLAQLSDHLGVQLEDLEQEIFDLSGGYGNFNINSPKQLNDVLFGKLGLSVKGAKKTVHGYSTDSSVLEGLRDAHDIVGKILDYRELVKLKGTYVDALPALINPRTGRVHTSYNQTGTTTGRLSSNNPNLQNIPIRTELGREVRAAFIAPKGTKLLAVDYSQIELRVLAHMSQDVTLMEAFQQGQDIHAATASAVYGVPLSEVTRDQRSFAKRVNFGLIYGMGAFRLARDSDLSLGEAERFIQTYFDRLPRVNEYLEATKQLAREQGYLTTISGRKRYFPLLQNATEGSNKNVIWAEERVAINLPIQGSAADIIKKAMIQLHAELQRRKLHSRMILQVHDELVLEVPEAEIETAAPLVVEIMENAAPLTVPLKANAEVGDNWRDMQSV